MFEIYNDDCFNILPKIKNKSVDMVLVDLPYGQTACKWDSIIDLKQMWVELKKCCKRKCIYVFFTTTKFGYKIIQSNEKWFRYDLVWQKSRKVGFLSCNKMPLRKHEMIYLFSNTSGGKKTYNPQKTEGKPYKKNENLYVGKVYNNGIPFINTSLDNKSGLRHPTTIVKFNNPKKSLHRTQKPVDLCEWLIKSYTNENDLVLDFTMGSGTTGVACKNTNRQFIGIEKDKKIFEIAFKRIQELLT